MIQASSSRPLWCFSLWSTLADRPFAQPLSVHTISIFKWSQGTHVEESWIFKMELNTCEMCVRQRHRNVSEVTAGCSSGLRIWVVWNYRFCEHVFSVSTTHCTVHYNRVSLWVLFKLIQAYHYIKHNRARWWCVITQSGKQMSLLCCRDSLVLYVCSTCTCVMKVKAIS